ncbi:MAG: tyrosine-type recombinase/integrase [Holdemanella sp.]|nr:tyrosine-type recombinase/integrase [Holdemanella sp.]
MRRIKEKICHRAVSPIKDARDINAFMMNLKTKYINAKSEVKRYQAHRNYMIALLGFNTALRAEDLLQLRVSEIKKGYVHIKENKTGKMQNFRLNKEITEEIKKYIETWNLNDYDYMFLGQYKQMNGKPYKIAITSKRAREVLQTTAEQVGIDRFGLHSLRKTFGYQYLKNGGNAETLMKMYNHSSYDITRRYTMWGSDDAEKDRTRICIGLADGGIDT